MIAAYVSGHGFGHATRVGEVLRAVREQAPEIRLSVVTSAPEALFRRAVPGPLGFRAVLCDVGLAQAGPLVIDEPGTVERWRAFSQQAPARVASEAAWLGGAGVRLVLADIPALAFDAAAEANVPAVGLANFSWDWIYRHLARREPGLIEAAEASAASYGKAELLLQLPFAGDLSVFPHREEIPLVARRPKRPRDEVRRALELGEGPLVLLSFGGLGGPVFDLTALGREASFHFLTTGGESPAANVRNVSGETLETLGLGYEDLVGAVDVVVTKPGYGIVSDAIAARTRVVYTERGDFPEYAVLVQAMPRYLPCVHVSNDELRTGRLKEALDSVLRLPFPAPPNLSGASVAASRLTGLWRARSPSE